MRFLLAQLLLSTASAFLPVAPRQQQRPSTTARAFFGGGGGLDPSHYFTDISFSLADLPDDPSTLLPPDMADPSALVDAAAATATDSGWFGFLTAPIEGLLQIIHTAIASGITSTNAWGVSIIVLTLLIKGLTFPLTKTQLESTNKMQAMQPAIKEIQAKYQSNPEVMNQKMAEFYQVNEINPLAGCLPSLVQIPVFIGLYRAVLELAKANKLDESFLFLPNLEGPTYGADPGSAMDWLMKGWVDGVPALGWDDTIAFLILPVFLVISQFISMELMQPKNQDPSAQQANIILKVLPIMIGWFALSVPAALSIYWVTNNIVTTASSLWIRNSMKVAPPKTAGGGATTMEAPSTIFAPQSTEKPVGFGSMPSISNDEVTPLTNAIDAEVVETSLGDSGEGMPTPTKKRRKVKKKKNRS